MKPTTSSPSWAKTSVRGCLAAEFPGAWGSEPGRDGPNAHILRSTNLDDDGHINFSTAAKRWIDELNYTERRLQEGDVLLETSGGGPGKPVGRVAHFQPPDSNTYLCSNFFRTLRPNARKVASRFLAWRLLHLYRQPSIWNFQQQTTGIINLKTHDYLEQCFLLPETDEQSRIAVALDTVDEAIAKTEAVIAKLRQVRAGLLHDLLTRGLDDNGQLRDPVGHPEHFQDSPLGQIPQEWDVCTLRDCLIGNPQNGIYKPANAIGRGTHLVGQTSITEERSLDLSLARRAEITTQELEHYHLREGDILVSRVFATLNGVGQPALVPHLSEAAVYESNMMRLRVRPDALAPMLLFHWLRTSGIRSRLLSQVNLSNQASVNQQALNSLPVIVPTLNEQEAMIAAIGKDDDCRNEYGNELAKLRALKSGMMDDLLTGRVRVSEGNEK